MGLVHRLDGGTLFMDEIGELAPDAQAMLLRFLQAGEGRAVGASRSFTTDVRVIAATHRDLEARVEQGGFREDVYYRLWCAVLEVPPLRDRREDIEILVDHFRKEANLGSSLEITGFTDEALTVLASDKWPGNVRELEAVVRRAMVRRRHGWVTATDIVFPKLRRKGLVEAVLASGVRLTSVQEQTLRLAAARGEVRRRDVASVCGISPELARRALLGLEQSGILGRTGRARGTRYVLRNQGG
jgi:DNA-binding NtrC family response regulator